MPGNAQRKSDKKTIAHDLRLQPLTTRAVAQGGPAAFVAPSIEASDLLGSLSLYVIWGPPCCRLGHTSRKLGTRPTLLHTTYSGPGASLERQKNFAYLSQHRSPLEQTFVPSHLFTFGSVYLPSQLCSLALLSSGHPYRRPSPPNLRLRVLYSPPASVRPPTSESIVAHGQSNTQCCSGSDVITLPLTIAQKPISSDSKCLASLCSRRRPVSKPKRTTTTPFPSRCPAGRGWVGGLLWQQERQRTDGIFMLL